MKMQNKCVHFFEAACFFLLLFLLLKKLLKKQEKYDLFPNFYFIYFFPQEKIACYIVRSHFIFLDSRINFSICCENCHVCLAAILKK